MAVKDLIFRILGEDTVSPVFGRIAEEAKASAGEVAAAYKGASRSVEESMAKTDTAGASGFKGVLAGAKTASLGIIAIGAVAVGEAVHMAAGFQSATTRLVTSAGESKKNLGQVSQGLEDMAGKIGYSTQTLATGMYNVESAGFHGASGLKVMTAASKGARIEGADLSTVTDAVTTALNSYHQGAGKAAQDTNVMLAAVSRGKTTFEDLAKSMPTVLPAAAAVHVSFAEVAGAMATMTAQGTPAAKAATYLRQTMLQLASGGTAKAQVVLEGLGLSGAGVSRELGNKGLASTITTITQAIQTHLTPATQQLYQQFLKSKNPTQAYRELMAKMPGPMNATFASLTSVFGGVKGLQSVLELSGPHMKTFQANTKAIADSAKDSGHQIAGWGTYQATMNAKLDEAEGSVSALATEVGMDLIPYVTKLIGYVGEATAFLAKHKTEVEIVGVALLGLAAGFIAVSVAVALLTNPIFDVVAAIALVSAGLTIAYRDSKTFRDIVNTAWADIKVATRDVVTVTTDLWHAFGSDIVSTAKGFLSGIVLEFKGFFDILTGIFDFWKDLFTGNWSALGGDLEKIVSGIWEAIEGVFTVGMSLVVGSVKVGWTLLKAATFAAWGEIGAGLSAAWGGIGDAYHASLRGLSHVFHGFASTFTSAWSLMWDTQKRILVDAWHIITAVFKGLLEAFVLPWKLTWDLITGKSTGSLTQINTMLKAKMAEAEGYVSDGMHKVLSVFSGIWSDVESVTSQTWTDVKNDVSKGVGDVVGAIASIPGKIEDLGSRMVSAGKSIISDIFSGIEQAAKSAGSFVGSLASTVATAIKNEINAVLHLPLVVSFHHFGIDIDQTVIPALAKGGIVTSPTFALIGEAGPEAVIPLTGLMPWSNGPVRGGDGGSVEGQSGHTAAVRGGPALNIEHFHADGQTPYQVAMSLLFLAV